MQIIFYGDNLYEMSYANFLWRHASCMKCQMPISFFTQYGNNVHDVQIVYETIKAYLLAKKEKKICLSNAEFAQTVEKINADLSIDWLQSPVTPVIIHLDEPQTNIMTIKLVTSDQPL